MLRLTALGIVKIILVKFVYTAYQNAPHFNVLPVKQVSRKSTQLLGKKNWSSILMQWSEPKYYFHVCSITEQCNFSPPTQNSK